MNEWLPDSLKTAHEQHGWGGGMTEDDIPSPYCPTCGHCGEIGCCGITTFLEKHVRGKTDCMYEDEILDEIEEWFEMQKEAE